MTSRPPPRTRRTRFRPSRRTSRNSMSERAAVKGTHRTPDITEHSVSVMFPPLEGSRHNITLSSYGNMLPTNPTGNLESPVNQTHAREEEPAENPHCQHKNTLGKKSSSNFQDTVFISSSVSRRSRHVEQNQMSPL